MGYPKQAPRAVAQPRVRGPVRRPTRMVRQARAKPGDTLRGIPGDELGDELGFSIGGALKKVGSAVKAVAKPVAKVAVGAVKVGAKVGAAVGVPGASVVSSFINKPKAEPILSVPEIAPPPPPPPSASSAADVKAQHARAIRSPRKGAAVNNAQRPVRTLPPKATVSTTDNTQAVIQPVKSSTDKARAVVSAGNKANALAKRLAAQVRSQSAKLDALKAAGDSAGASQMSEMIANLQRQAEGAARTAEQYGAAAQGAAVGAVAGAAQEQAQQGFGDFIKSPAGMATGAAALIGGFLLLNKRKAS